MPTSTRKMQPGYAYKSSKRYPKQPTMEIVSQEDCDNAKWIGFESLDYQAYSVFKLGKTFYFQLTLATEVVELPYTEFSLSDVDNGRIYASRDELIYNPPKWLDAGLTQTRTGYGRKLNSGLSIHFEGKVRRIYITQFSNAGMAWFMFGNQQIIVS